MPNDLVRIIDKLSLEKDSELTIERVARAYDKHGICPYCVDGQIALFYREEDYIACASMCR